MKYVFLFIILLIPALIFLFLKGMGTNQFVIPVYYEDGVPPQQHFNCAYEEGPYRISWPSTLSIETPAALYLTRGLNAPRRNMIRRIDKAGNAAIQVFSSTKEKPLEGITITEIDSASLVYLMHCSFASDTLDQWVLVDQENRIRGYYNTTLEEQDRLLDELSILLSE